MSFIQIIDYETNRADEVDAQMRAAIQRMPGGPTFARLEHTRDHDNPNHFLTIVEFPSYEAAMANSSRPETDEMARQLSALCTSGPRYTNLDVKMSVP
jgi:quinol monooxygenase YgiN